MCVVKSPHAGRLCSVLGLLLVLACPSARVLGQTTLSLQNLNSIRFADQFNGSDWCAKLNAADSDLGSTSGTVVLASNAGTAPCASAPTLSPGHTLMVVGGPFSLGSNTLSLASKTSIVSSARFMPTFRYTGGGDAILLQNTNWVTLSGVGVDLKGAGPNAIGIHLKATAAQATVFNHLDGIFIENSGGVTAGQTGLELQATGTYGQYQCVFNHFDNFLIKALDVPAVDTNGNEANSFVSMLIWTFGHPGAPADAITSDGEREQFYDIRFSGGNSRATGGCGFNFTAKAGGNIAIGDGDFLSGGRTFCDKATNGPNFEAGTYVLPTTLGSPHSVLPTSGTYNNANLTAAVSPTDVATSVQNGNYRVCYNARTTTSSETGTTGTVSISWTDEGGAKTFTSASWALNSVTLAGQVNGCLDVYAVAGSNIQVSTSIGSIGASKYALQASAEQLQ